MPRKRMVLVGSGLNGDGKGCLMYGEGHRWWVNQRLFINSLGVEMDDAELYEIGLGIYGESTPRRLRVSVYYAMQ